MITKLHNNSFIRIGYFETLEILLSNITHSQFLDDFPYIKWQIWDIVSRYIMSELAETKQHVKNHSENQ